MHIRVKALETPALSHCCPRRTHRYKSDPGSTHYSLSHYIKRSPLTQREATCIYAKPQTDEGNDSYSAIDSSERLFLDALRKEEYRYYDEAVITVRSGRGGNGEVIAEKSGKYVKNYKYNPGKSTPKVIWLPAAKPADGGAGGDVVLSCDMSLDSLSHFHLKNVFSAKNGPNGNPEDGSQSARSLFPAKRPKRDAPPLVIRVPPGTVVKRKRSGQFLGELLKRGDRLLVAKGGQGGYGTIVKSKKKGPKTKMKATKNESTKVQTITVSDSDWRADVPGMPGEELTLQLLLRIVADVGFVGLPNAGKSALLSTLSKARPEIASYPFTTLIPNLGVMGRGGDPILVDLPGLIEGAHVGKGLGRNFLRHLRRTRILLHVVDAALPDPVGDYETILDELRMYNPEYCRRKNVIALNKVDLVSSQQTLKQLEEGIMTVASRTRDKVANASMPECIVYTSAVTGQGIDTLQQALQTTMESIKDTLPSTADERHPSPKKISFDSAFAWEDE